MGYLGPGPHGSGARVQALPGLIGPVVGLVFGGVTLALMSPLATPAFVARGLNEVLFPVGCSLVLYAANAQQAREPAKA